MASMTHQAPGRRITVGVDTHKDVHVAVALDGLGARLGESRLPATQAGYRRLERWACNLGPVETFAVEGTGSYGAGLARSGFRTIDPESPPLPAEIQSEVRREIVRSSLPRPTPRC